VDLQQEQDPLWVLSQVRPMTVEKDFVTYALLSLREQRSEIGRRDALSSFHRQHLGIV
jgi:hypothetical protein